MKNYIVCIFVHGNLLEESQKTSRSKRCTKVHPNGGMSEAQTMRSGKLIMEFKSSSLKIQVF